jgi:hypothetical protein
MAKEKTASGATKPPTEDLAKLKEEAEGKDAPPEEAAEPVEPVKKKRGRRKAKEVEPALPPGVAANLVDGITSFVAMRKGDKWRATPQESASIGRCLELVIEKYAPFAAKYGPEIGLATAVFAYLFVRVEASDIMPAVGLPAPAAPEPEKEAPGYAPDEV